MRGVCCGRPKIVAGRVAKLVKAMALMEQPFIKDTEKTVETVIKEATAAIGEKISVRRFSRYARPHERAPSCDTTGICAARAMPGLAVLGGGLLMMQAALLLAAKRNQVEVSIPTC